MKKIALIFILVFICNFGFCQKKIMKSIPILFDTVKVDISFKRKRLEIKDTHLSDSLRITFKVALEFKNSLNDTTKLIKIKSVRLAYLDVMSLTTKKQYRIDLLEETKWSRCQKDIWNRYSKILKYWYLNQPYEKMLYREGYGEKNYFGGILYAKP